VTSGTTTNPQCPIRVRAVVHTHSILFCKCSIPSTQQLAQFFCRAANIFIHSYMESGLSISLTIFSARFLHNTFATVANRWGCRCDSHYCIQIPGKSLTSYDRDSAQAKVLLIALSVRRKVHDLCSPVEDCLGSRASCDTKSIKSVHFLVPTTNKQKLRRVAPWPLTCCRSSFLKSVAVVSKS
jgi:hypothetical protein